MDEAGPMCTYAHAWCLLQKAAVEQQDNIQLLLVANRIRGNFKHHAGLT